MSHQYDAQYVQGMFYVVECAGRHSRPNLYYHEALQYQKEREKEGRVAIIRTW